MMRACVAELKTAPHWEAYSKAKAFGFGQPANLRKEIKNDSNDSKKVSNYITFGIASLKQLDSLLSPRRPNWQKQSKSIFDGSFEDCALDKRFKLYIFICSNPFGPRICWNLMKANRNNTSLDIRRVPTPFLLPQKLARAHETSISKSVKRMYWNIKRLAVCVYMCSER